VVAFCRENEIWMNVEIKPVPGFEEVTGRVVAQYTKRMFGDVLELDATDPARAELPLFSSFSYDALKAAQRAAPDIPRACLLDQLQDGWRAKLDELDAVAVDTNHKHLSASQVKAVKDAGFGLFCYTINDPERAREVLDWGVDAICTDRIDLIGPRFA
jgi:glycerophosphoryl diester phosphodiesterase